MTNLEDDYLTTTHRGRRHMIAKGADLNKTAAELFGKKNRLLQRQRRPHVTKLDVPVFGQHQNL